MEIDEETKQISKYNDSMFSISRLNDSWIKCKGLIKNGNFNGWKYELDIIWLELYPDVLRNKSSRKSFEEDNIDLMKKIAYSKNKTELFFNLMKRHEFLRKIQDSAGKAGVYIDEDEEGFE